MGYRTPHVRQYSLISDAARRRSYRIAVLREPASACGSRYVHRAHEIRAWVAMAAALTSATGRPATGRTLACAAIPHWLTGMGVSLLTPTLQEIPA